MEDISLDVDPDAKREELIEDAEKAKKEHEAEQAELLNAVKEDEELSHDGFEWVEIGEAEFRVSTELSGRVIDILQAFDASDEEDLPPIKHIVEAAIIQTDVIRTEGTTWETEPKISEFWETYYNVHGSTVLETVSERILEPALEEQQERVPSSFPREQRR
jgi:hypothetical protein